MIDRFVIRELILNRSSASASCSLNISRKLAKTLPKDTSPFAVEVLIAKFSQRKHIVD